MTNLKKIVTNLLGITETYPRTTREVLSFAKRESIITMDYQGEITVIMPSLNRLTILKRALKALQKNTTVKFKLIIIDNGSNQETVNYLKKIEDGDKIKVIFFNKNLGAATARKHAMEYVNTEYVAFLDNDICIMPGYFENLIQTIQSDISIAGVQSKVIFPNGNIQINSPEADIKGEWVLFYDKDFGKKFDDKTTLSKKMCYWIPIGATLWRKEVFDKFSLDERMGTSFEDNDFALKVKSGGYKFSNSPKAMCIHFHSTFTPSFNDSTYSVGRYNLESVRNSAKIFYQNHKLIFAYQDAEKFAKEQLGFSSVEEYTSFVKS